ncbi:hypothetical protein HPB50_013192 [Hyalomma asiaticum]|uniref:Uncharacterized protein n=1 Tax=Hyalomma asiaticum TaxID=266040 RepID=A0ACB7SM98_HYAAI|nr:hypothetical protein HPB50_013192 [Hyalomma asiaticum]
MSSAPGAITNDVLVFNDGKTHSSGCPAPMFAATARVIGRQLQKRYVLRPGARFRVNMSVRRRTVVLVRGGVVCRRGLNFASAYEPPKFEGTNAAVKYDRHHDGRNDAAVTSATRTETERLN